MLILFSFTANKHPCLRNEKSNPKNVCKLPMQCRGSEQKTRELDSPVSGWQAKKQKKGKTSASGRKSGTTVWRPSDCSQSSRRLKKLLHVESVDIVQSRRMFLFYCCVFCKTDDNTFVNMQSLYWALQRQQSKMDADVLSLLGVEMKRRWDKRHLSYSGTSAFMECCVRMAQMDGSLSGVNSGHVSEIHFSIFLSMSAVKKIVISMSAVKKKGPAVSLHLHWNEPIRNSVEARKKPCFWKLEDTFIGSSETGAQFVFDSCFGSVHFRGEAPYRDLTEDLYPRLCTSRDWDQDEFRLYSVQQPQWLYH